MQEELANEIIACLPRGRTLFYYFADRYAAYLLSRHVGDGMPIAAVKQGRYGRLLARPHIAGIVAKKGDGMLSTADLDTVWPADPNCYRLTLGRWGSKREWEWQQTSRRGVNLVLQLNFPADHDTRYARLAGSDSDVFSFAGHPNARRGFRTLAWARLDIDLAAGTALIEEIQTDWLREVRALRAVLDKAGDDKKALARIVDVWFGAKPDDDRLDHVETAIRRYVDDVAAAHGPFWDEAMLTAALWFLIEEIGISEIYYHDAECGRVLKRIGYSAPPRSLYTVLPRRFCFEKTTEPPDFLTVDEPRRIKALQKAGTLAFWRMAA
ncbi:MAG: hypothetical protein KDJ16_02585 [Hyphomicrobiales bacterium]|nr:hypothetical protein [Hyphomicrobiales bacterium]